MRRHSGAFDFLFVLFLNRKCRKVLELGNLSSWFPVRNRVTEGSFWTPRAPIRESQRVREAEGLWFPDKQSCTQLIEPRENKVLWFGSGFVGAEIVNVLVWLVGFETVSVVNADLELSLAQTGLQFFFKYFIIFILCVI